MLNYKAIGRCTIGILAFLGPILVIKQVALWLGVRNENIMFFLAGLSLVVFFRIILWLDWLERPRVWELTSVYCDFCGKSIPLEKCSVEERLFFGLGPMKKHPLELAVCDICHSGLLAEGALEKGLKDALGNRDKHYPLLYANDLVGGTWTIHKLLEKRSIGASPFFLHEAREACAGRHKGASYKTRPVVQRDRETNGA